MIAGFLPIALSAQTAVQTAAPVADNAASNEETVKLPAFEVSAQHDNGFVGRSSLSTTRIAVDLSEIPQSVQVLNDSFLRAVNSLNLVDVLNYVGGAQNGQLAFVPGRVNIRGFTGDGDYVDGYAPPANIQLDPAIYDRFEVIKGPSTIMLAADGSPGGVVNKITKSPSTVAAASVTATVGLYDTDNIALDTTGPLTKDGALTYRAIGALQYSDGDYNAAWLHRTTFMPAATYRFGPSAKIDVKSLFINATEHWFSGLPIDPRTLSIFDLPRSHDQEVNSPFQWYFHDKVERLWVNFTDRLNEHVALHLAGMDASDFLRRVVYLATVWNSGARTWTVANYNGTQAFPAALVTDDANTLYHDLQGDVNLNFTTGPVANNLLVGGELNNGDLDRTSFPGTASAWNPYVNVAPTLNVNFGTISAKSVTDNTLARGYLLETAKFFKDQLLLSYGVSRARATASVFNNLTNAYSSLPYTLNKNLRQYGAVYKVLPGWNLFYGYNENFALNGVGILNGVSGPLPAKVGKQSEVGLKTSLLGGSLTANVSYFDVKQLNNTVPSVPFDPQNPNVLIPGVISRGFDGDLAYQVNRNLYLMGSFSWFDAKSVLGPAAATFVQPYYGRIVTGSIPDTNNAEQTWSLFGIYRFTAGAWRGLEVGLGVNYQAKKAITDSADQVMFGYIPGRTLANLNLSYTPNAHLKYSLFIDNLLDRHYLYSVRNESQVVVGDRLNLKFAVTYSR